MANYLGKYNHFCTPQLMQCTMPKRTIMCDIDPRDKKQLGVALWGKIIFEAVYILSYKIVANNTNRNILDNFYQLVKYFLDFPLWEYTIASFKQKLLIKRSNCVLPEREIWEMFY